VVTKQRIIEQILVRLNDELSRMAEAAKAAHEAATHEESRSEDRHDTRGLEASYLAGAQANRAAELKKRIASYRFLSLKDFASTDPIGPGALIELELNGKNSFYFLISQGEGVSFQVDGQMIQVITPRAPLGEALLGRKRGDWIEVERQNQTREYRVISIY
jgi:transcription elongation GreA/GreB family factor